MHMGVDYVTPFKQDDVSHDDQCQRGIDFILSHLVEPIFPRDIMTKKLGHKIEVFNRESILSHFQDSNYQDCRISAYPRLTQYMNINLVAPSLIMIDLDLSNFPLKKSLDHVLTHTLKRIYQLLKVTPTVLWTGNGYHIYLPLNAFILEEEKVFAKFVDQNNDHCNLSTKFIRFAQSFFTHNKHDQQHRPSVNSCLLRVPSTYNSKNREEAKIIQQWDGYKPSIKYLLREFRRYLIQEQLSKINNRNTKLRHQFLSPLYQNSGNDNPITIRWIDRLLQTPILDNRKYCIWRILAPYLVNVKKLSNDEALSVIITWLDNCNSIESLSFIPRPRARYNIQTARRIGYYPLSLKVLRAENTNLYNLLQDRNIIDIQVR
jgi:Primase X